MRRGRSMGSQGSCSRRLRRRKTLPSTGRAMPSSLGLSRAARRGCCRSRGSVWPAIRRTRCRAALSGASEVTGLHAWSYRRSLSGRRGREHPRSARNRSRSRSVGARSTRSTAACVSRGGRSAETACRRTSSEPSRSSASCVPAVTAPRAGRKPCGGPRIGASSVSSKRWRRCGRLAPSATGSLAGWPKTLPCSRTPRPRSSRRRGRRCCVVRMTLPTASARSALPDPTEHSPARTASPCRIARGGRGLGGGSAQIAAARAWGSAGLASSAAAGRRARGCELRSFASSTRRRRPASPFARRTLRSSSRIRFGRSPCAA